jgi:hypothetical protein
MSMPAQSPKPTSSQPAPSQDLVTRLFGGPPLAVLARLALVSILVGVILEALGFDPWNILDSIRRLVQHIWDLGFDAVRYLWRYLALGAVIVVPVWLVMRLAGTPRGR